MFKVGIIGFGKIGHLRARLVDSHPDLQLDSICDIVDNRSEQYSRIPMLSAYQDVLARSPDIIFVCCSNDMIAEATVAALDSGCHVFSEKPPGRNVAEVKAIIAAEKRNPGCNLKFGFNHRYHDSVIQAHRLVEGNRLGKVLAVKGIYGKSGAVDYMDQWRNIRAVSGGGILLDQGIHMLDLMLLFCGSFNEVRSFVDHMFWNIDVEDNVFAILRNKDRQLGMLISSATMWKHTFHLDITLEEGYLSLKGILSNSMSYGRESLVVARKSYDTSSIGNPDEQTYFFDEDLSWEKEIKEFVDCIKEKKCTQIGTSGDALRVMELIDQIYRADSVWSARYLEN